MKVLQILQVSRRKERQGMYTKANEGTTHSWSKKVVTNLRPNLAHRLQWLCVCVCICLMCIVKASRLSQGWIQIMAASFFFISNEDHTHTHIRMARE